MATVQAIWQRRLTGWRYRRDDMYGYVTGQFSRIAAAAALLEKIK